MLEPPQQPDRDDLKARENLKRIDDLEAFRKAFEGKEFDKKIAESIKDSNLVAEEIRTIAWRAVKDKILWVFLGGVGLIFLDLLLRAIPRILSLLSPR